MDEDIKIAEHLLEYLQLKIDNGVHKIQYNELLHDEKTIDCLNAIENLLIRLKTAERMNDVLIEVVCNNTVPKEECKDCIKEWARKKVSND